ncbi:MAG: D-glycerate dehydrogenase [Rickettsiales bacterium]|nr:D-glycerate dehydrogenase [Rickettsiales bacterium]
MHTNLNILLTRKLPDSIEKKLSKQFKVLVNSKDKLYTYNELKKKIENIDILVPSIGDTIDSSIIRSAKKLKMIANFGNGVDNIDLITAKEEKITVTNTPEVLTDDTADIVILMMLMLTRETKQAEKTLYTGNWTGWGPSKTVGQRIKGKKLGIIGMGRIGQAVSKRAITLGLEINYHNRKKLPLSLEKNLNAKYWKDLDMMIKVMDIISIHCPYTSETFHLLSKSRLKRLKKKCILINTSRGEIIDENELANLLISKKIAGAGLDVFENEPQISPKLFEAENVVLLPHISSATIESRLEMGNRVIKNITDFVNMRKPKDTI